MNVARFIPWPVRRLWLTETRCHQCGEETPPIARLGSSSIITLCDACGDGFRRRTRRLK